ncbi:ammonium transporter [Actinomycetes bacterium M1A6_2h]
MNLRRLVATSALMIASLGVYAGTAYADPAPAAPTAEQGAIKYEAKIEDKVVKTTVDGGIFKVTDDGKEVQLLDATGKTVLLLPLTFNLGNIEFPFETTITDEGRTINLFPNMMAPTVVAPLAQNNVASPDENLKAQQAFTSQLGLATAVGGLTGTIIGAGIGCIAGGTPLVLPTCLAGAVTGAGIGGVVGTIAAGGPTLVIAGIDYLNTLNAAPGTTQWATK